MNILFVHDFKAIYDESTDAYYSTGFPYSIWIRYLKVFENLKIVCRSENFVSNTYEYNISSGKNVTFSPTNKYTSLKSLILNYKEIKSSLSEEVLKADGVIIRVPSVLGFLVASICRKENKPYLVEVVGSMFDTYWYYGNLLSKLIAFPSEIIQKKTIKNSDIAIYITDSYLQKKYHTCGEQFDSISNVILDDQFDEEVIPKYNIDNHKIKLGLVGSTYVNYKGHDLAIRAVYLLRKKGYNVTLEFVGQGLSENVKDLIVSYNLENIVNYLGVIKNSSEMNKWYKSLDIYIQPSKTEGHGRAVVEAISNGVTVIASNIGGLPDSIQKEFLFESKNIDEMTKLIERCINNMELRKKNIDGNIEKVKKYKKSIVEGKRKVAFNRFRKIVGG